MRLRPVLHILGLLIAAVGTAMLTAVVLSYFYNERDFNALLISALLAIGSGLLITGSNRSDSTDLSAREGFAIVTLGWLIIPLFGCIPYLLSGFIPSFTDAYFEAVSGFTTTGASILTDVEALPHGLLFWRSLTHWIGGMGIIVLYLAILPLLGVGAMQLFKAEVSGPSKDKLTPRVVNTARLLSGVYLLLTAAETILLLAGGMPLFDAVCHAFGTIATGGFSTKNASIGFYHSPYIDGVVSLFMILGGTNFALHYAALRGKPWEYMKSEEFIYYISVFTIVVLTLTIANGLVKYQGDFIESFRYTTFNVASIMSCTGYSTADFAKWIPLSQLTLLVLMFPGGCGGSTAGGIKNIRVLLLLKSIVGELKRSVFRRAIIPTRLDGKSVDDDLLANIGGFVTLYLTIFIGAMLILVGTGLDLVSASSAVASCMAGVGPGLGSVGPMANYAHLSGVAKWVLDLCMVLGRLEIFTVLVFVGSLFWEK